MAGSAQAAKAPKPKDYTYCVASGTESECFEAPFEVFRKTRSWAFEETKGEYSVHGKIFNFRERNGPDELVGRRDKEGVISGTLLENEKPTEFTFTLTPVPR